MPLARKGPTYSRKGKYKDKLKDKTNAGPVPASQERNSAPYSSSSSPPPVRKKTESKKRAVSASNSVAKRDEAEEELLARKKQPKRQKKPAAIDVYRGGEHEISLRKRKAPSVEKDVLREGIENSPKRKKKKETTSTSIFNAPSSHKSQPSLMQRENKEIHKHPEAPEAPEIKGKATVRLKPSTSASSLRSPSASSGTVSISHPFEPPHLLQFLATSTPRSRHGTKISRRFLKASKNNQTVDRTNVALAPGPSKSGGDSAAKISWCDGDTSPALHDKDVYQKHMDVDLNDNEDEIISSSALFFPSVASTPTQYDGLLSPTSESSYSRAERNRPFEPPATSTPKKRGRVSQANIVSSSPDLVHKQRQQTSSRPSPFLAEESLEEPVVVKEKEEVNYHSKSRDEQKTIIGLVDYSSSSSEGEDEETIVLKYLQCRPQLKTSDKGDGAEGEILLSERPDAGKAVPLPSSPDLAQTHEQQLLQKLKSPPIAHTSHLDTTALSKKEPRSKVVIPLKLDMPVRKDVFGKRCASIPLVSGTSAVYALASSLEAAYSPGETAQFQGPTTFTENNSQFPDHIPKVTRFVEQEKGILELNLDAVASASSEPAFKLLNTTTPYLSLSSKSPRLTDGDDATISSGFKNAISLRSFGIKRVCFKELPPPVPLSEDDSIHSENNDEVVKFGNGQGDNQGFMLPITHRGSPSPSMHLHLNQYFENHHKNNRTHLYNCTEDNGPPSSELCVDNGGSYQMREDSSEDLSQPIPIATKASLSKVSKHKTPSREMYGSDPTYQNDINAGRSVTAKLKSTVPHCKPGNFQPLLLTKSTLRHITQDDSLSGSSSQCLAPPVTTTTKPFIQKPTPKESGKHLPSTETSKRASIPKQSAATGSKKKRKRRSSWSTPEERKAAAEYRKRKRESIEIAYCKIKEEKYIGDEMSPDEGKDDGCAQDRI